MLCSVVSVVASARSLACICQVGMLYYWGFLDFPKYFDSLKEKQIKETVFIEILKIH